MNLLMRLNQSDSDQLGRIYHLENLKIGRQDSHLWISGFSDEEQFERTLAMISPVQQFSQDQTGKVFQRHQRVPCLNEFRVDWVAIQKFVTVEVPQARIAGQPPGDVSIQVQRMVDNQGPFAKRPNVLVCELNDLSQWAGAASEFKMNPLVFATNGSDGCTVICGKTLPPIPGRYLCESDGIAVPAGFELVPAIQPKVLAKWFSLNSGDIVLFEQGNQPRKIDAGKFAALRRSAVRLTVKELNREHD